MEEDPIDQVTSARRERLMALRAAKEYASMLDADGDGNKNNRMEEQSTTNDYEQNDFSSTTMEEDPIDQVTSAHRERLMALRAAKGYASMADADGDGNKNNRMEEQSTTNDYEHNTTMEEDPIDQVTSARRERLMALRAAKEYAGMPDADGDGNKNNRMEEQSTTNDYEQNRVPETIEEGSTEQASAARKERLMALKTAKELLSTTDNITKNNGRLEDTEENGENIAPNMKFRNYLPHDKHLQEGKLAPVELPKFEDPVNPAAPQPSEKIEDPFVNIAPKKPNWDLRRDVQKRLDKLERRTQKALYELMLEQEKEKSVTEHGNDGYAD